MRTLLLLSLLLTFPAVLLRAAPLPVGSPAPKVTAPNQDGTPVDFAKIYSKGMTLVYFYPKAGTSGCTAEACSLRDSYAKLRAEGLQIIGVSRDSVEALKKFQQEDKLPFTLIADPQGSIADDFGVPKVLGVLPYDARQSFLVKKGKIVWNSPNAATDGSAKEVEGALAHLRGDQG